jgi:hypothetical protein
MAGRQGSQGSSLMMGSDFVRDGKRLPFFTPQVEFHGGIMPHLKFNLRVFFVTDNPYRPMIRLSFL